MARFIAKKKMNIFKASWRKFNSLDLFIKYTLITCLLLFLATPFVIYNNQTYNVGAVNQAQRLEEIQQIQQSQTNLRRGLAKAQPSSQQINSETSASSSEFNLAGIIRSIFMQIMSLFK